MKAKIYYGLKGFDLFVLLFPFTSGVLIQMNREISLYDLEQVGLIILNNSGVTYFNQTGGTACLQSRAEGLFAPLSDDGINGVQEKLACITKDLVSLTEEVGLEVEQVFAEFTTSDRISVNFEKLDESHESWIHVNVIPVGDASIFTHFSPFKGIITWPSSD